MEIVKNNALISWLAVALDQEVVEEIWPLHRQARRPRVQATWFYWASKLSGSSIPVIFWRDFSYRPLDDVIPRGLVLQVFSCVPPVVPSSRIDCDFQILVKGRNVQVISNWFSIFQNTKCEDV